MVAKALGGDLDTQQQLGVLLVEELLEPIQRASSRQAAQDHGQHGFDPGESSIWVSTIRGGSGAELGYSRQRGRSRLVRAGRGAKF
mgnify:CR=1 FL=1